MSLSAICQGLTELVQLEQASIVAFIGLPLWKLG